MKVGAVVIGRNEGARLVSCLQSVVRQVDRVVYVDSGSTDGSQAVARGIGADVVALDMDRPFTAARARNEGIARLRSLDPDVHYVQFIDGDCDLRPSWVETAAAVLNQQSDTAVVCGRRRERFPKASVYNALIDMEWDTPTGEVLACGGDALMRVSALVEVGGFDPSLIAGEEPELCVRLRQSGWKVWRIDAEMTLHDAALTRFSQWWKRNKRAGHAYAEGYAMHGGPPECHGARETRSAILWGLLIPLFAFFGTFWSVWSLLLLLAWPLQILRLGLRDNNWLRATFLTLGKLPEAQGMIGYWWNRWRGKRSGLIEYK